MHPIRLRRPWTKQVTGPDGLPTESTVDIPDHEPNSVGNEWTYHRSFNCPTGLDEGSRVFLSISDWQGHMASVSINDQVCDSTQKPPLRIDVTLNLQPSNCLRIQLIPEGQTSPLLCGDVQLEIEN